MSPKVLSHRYHDSPVRSKSGLSHKLDLFVVLRDNFQERRWEFYSPIPPLLSATKADVISSVMTISSAESCSPHQPGAEHRNASFPDLQWSMGSIGHSWNYLPQVLLKWQTLNPTPGLYEAFFSNLEVKWEPVMVHWKQPDSAQK